MNPRAHLEIPPTHRIENLAVDGGSFYDLISLEPKMSLTNCRFYEEKYPEIDSFVMVSAQAVFLLVAMGKNSPL